MASEPSFASSRADPAAAAASTAMRRALLLAFLWINASEVFRYFAFVMPMTRTAMSQVPDVAPMTIPVFLVWGAWDTLLFACVSVIAWLYFERFGGGIVSILMVATLLWVTIFVLFWLATWNMSMTHHAIPLVALPLAWIEMAIAAALIERGWQNARTSQQQ